MSTRTFELTPCLRCGTDIIDVRWDHQEGMPPIGTARLDPTPLTPQQVVACILTGIHIWHLHAGLTGPRTSHHNRWWPARLDPGHMLPIHDCARTWTGDPITLDTPTPPGTPNICPF